MARAGNKGWKQEKNWRDGLGPDAEGPERQWVFIFRIMERREWCPLMSTSKTSLQMLVASCKIWPQFTYNLLPCDIATATIERGIMFLHPLKSSQSYEITWLSEGSGHDLESSKAGPQLSYHTTSSHILLLLCVCILFTTLFYDVSTSWGFLLAEEWSLPPRAS